MVIPLLANQDLTPMLSSVLCNNDIISVYVLNLNAREKHKKNQDTGYYTTLPFMDNHSQ